jgi:hypothetical protein
MKVLCEKCEGNKATMFYRNYVGPHAVCRDCYYRFVRPKMKYEKMVPSSKNEYIEEVVVDQIMTQ